MLDKGSYTDINGTFGVLAGMFTFVCLRLWLSGAQNSKRGPTPSDLAVGCTARGAEKAPPERGYVSHVGRQKQEETRPTPRHYHRNGCTARARTQSRQARNRGHRLSPSFARCSW
jgi:hypothetical protein